MRQHTMPLGLPDYASFDNYYATANSDAVTLLREFLKTGNAKASAYLWGESGVGKTHLLYSACRDCESSIYISASDAKIQPDVLDCVHDYALACIDDVQAIAQHLEWEKRLMTALERAESETSRLLVAADLPPDSLGLALPDLQSRLAGRQVLRLRPISDDDRMRVLLERAARRGMTIEPNVARYAISRHCRNMHSVLELLERIDQLSLEQHRRITIPLLNRLDSMHKPD